MTTTILREALSSTPFTLNFVEKLDPVLYDEAIKISEILGESYDPETQTSNVTMYSGTALTYADTGGGLSNRDTRQSDT